VLLFVGFRPVQGRAYDRQAVFDHAMEYWNQNDPKFDSHPCQECTPFASQCLW